MKEVLQQGECSTKQLAHHGSWIQNTAQVYIQNKFVCNIRRAATFLTCIRYSYLLLMQLLIFYATLLGTSVNCWRFARPLCSFVLSPSDTSIYRVWMMKRYEVKIWITRFLYMHVNNIFVDYIHILYTIETRVRRWAKRKQYTPIHVNALILALEFSDFLFNVFASQQMFLALPFQCAASV